MFLFKSDQKWCFKGFLFALIFASSEYISQGAGIPESKQHPTWVVSTFSRYL